METNKISSNELYKDLLIDYEKTKWIDISFEESFKTWFLPLAFTKLEEWYYVKCITSDLKYNFRILEDWSINWWWKNNFMWKDIENFIEMKQAVINMWWLYAMSQGWNPDTRIIPIEKIKKLNLDWLEEYIKELEKHIEENQDDYKQRVEEIIRNWSENL